MKEAGLTKDKVVSLLSSKSDEKNKAGMARYGINVEKAFGISVNELREIAKRIGKNHELAMELWESGYREARHLAVMIEEVDRVTGTQMGKRFRFVGYMRRDVHPSVPENALRLQKVDEWMKSDKEFVRRAAFALIAALAVHDKKAEDGRFEVYFNDIKRCSVDERNYVKKAVNWALRQIGKRNRRLNKLAVGVAKELKTSDSKSAGWIGSDALRELTNPKVVMRFK
ncbi:hypothetical protein MROS_0923 [Melioribacter roseus P3M-2]|uniref:DNA alkylation repair enzyme n=1 Tax=Melioribacter roseus (strain DSM 23840 / JCM 17771 / VKM B-2668 / P3M-2) TaxID=1191523 RepID=I6ZQ19_MELRP|nr:DNA alkylation repair protein [Melioribacter roseus]AFN74164.1 hypothetical protein MROS_0923 [Melioribacter roseus P3M-2]